MKRFLAYGATLALAVTLGPVAPVGSAPSAMAAQPPVVAVGGALESAKDSSGQPAARRIESARVRYVPSTGRTTATVVLRAAPTPSTDAELVVVFGAMANGGCAAEAQWATPTHGTTAANFTRSGRTYSLAVTAPRWQGWWDCAVATVREPGNNDVAATYDAFGNQLSTEYAKPRLVIGKPAILNQKPKRLPLVRGVWTTVRVPVRNTGRWRAANTVVGGKGPGLQVRRAKLGIVYDDSTQTARLRVRLKAARKQSRLRLVVRGGGVRATRTVRVRRVAAPPRPAAGRYRGVGKNKNITFRVRNGRIVKFRGKRFRMRCQPPMEYARYHYTDLTHRNRAVPRNGIVDDVHEWKKKGGNAWFTSMLEGRLVGNRLTRGRFSYFTSGSCRVDVRFTARRVGR